MESRGYTPLKAAIDLSLDMNSVSRYESGAREAGDELLTQFADYYNVSIDKSLGMRVMPRLWPYCSLEVKNVRLESNYFSSAFIKLSMTSTAPLTPMRLLSMHRS